MDIYERSLALHSQYQGKYSIESKVAINNFDDLSLAYSPGVAAPCKAIAADKSKVYEYTAKGKTIAVISDGSAVLGLGNIGPYAAGPVMEGKAILFKAFAGINAIPLSLDTQDTEEIIRTCEILAPSLGGINLEDISAPRCFEIEQRLKERLDIPVFHDDQHGTAIVVAAAVMNANRLSGKSMADLRVVVSGLGAAGVAIVKILHDLGVKEIVAINSKGVVNEKNHSNAMVARLLQEGIIKNEVEKSSLADALVGSNLFVGVSVAGVLNEQMVQSMARDPYIFALANPEPEILPEIAHQAGAFVVGTGRSDYPNQINNVLAFPGIFHGVLRGSAKRITNEMKIAAAEAIAQIISDDELRVDYLIPSAFDERVVARVSDAIVAISSN